MSGVRPDSVEDWAEVFRFCKPLRPFTRGEIRAATYLRTSPVGILWPAICEIPFNCITEAATFFDFDPLGRAASLFHEELKAQNFIRAKSIFDQLLTINQELRTNGEEHHYPGISDYFSARFESV